MDTRQLTHEVRLKHWAEVLRRRRASGQTNRSFCRTEGINEKTFYYWQRRLRELAGAELAVRDEQPSTTRLPSGPIFAALPLPQSSASTDGVVRIEIGGAVVEIGTGADMDVAMGVLRMLTGQC
jgi:putative transposase